MRRYTVTQRQWDEGNDRTLYTLSTVDAHYMLAQKEDVIVFYGEGNIAIAAFSGFVRVTSEPLDVGHS